MAWSAPDAPGTGGCSGAGGSMSAAITVAVAVARVLIVDDNVDVAEILALLLGRDGFETRVAYDATSALRVAAEWVPQVAVVDIGLPDLDGYELAGRLRRAVSAAGAAALYLIATTGYHLQGDRRKSHEAGFDEHMIKPFDIRDLRRTIDERSKHAAEIASPSRRTCRGSWR